MVFGGCVITEFPKYLICNVQRYATYATYKSILYIVHSFIPMSLMLIIILYYLRSFIISLQCDSPEVNSEIRGRAQQIAERLSFDGFIEASAKNNHKVEWIFEKAVCLVSLL